MSWYNASAKAVPTAPAATGDTLPRGRVLHSNDGYRTRARGISMAVTVTSSPGAINAALAAIDGDRRVGGWDGVWLDTDPDVLPDWFEVTFAGPTALDEISVFSVSDDFSTSEPTLRTPFTLFGLTDVEVQYWTGTQWLAVPGGTISGNTLVWRRLTFAPIPPTRIRVFVTQALANYTRIVEVEAWGTPISLPGSIEGTVMSASVAVSGATVEALHGGQAHATTSTSSSGTYALPHLAAGLYDVRVSATNYLPQTQPGIIVTSGGTTTANVDLVPGGGSGGPSGDTVTYYHTDAIGSVRMTTDATGQVIGRYDYLPFGEPWPATPAVPDPKQFTGQERDPETGFDYVGARYYQSQTGRFTRPDDPGYANPFNPQSMNLYAYAYNNPLRYIDPTGHQGDCVAGYDSNTGLCQPDYAWEQAQRFARDSGQYLNQQLASAAQQQREQQQPTTESPFNFDKLAQCASDQLGLSDLFAVGAIVAGWPIPGTKPFVTAGSSRGTSLAGMAADRVFGGARFPVRVPTIVGGPGTGRAFAIAGTKSVARFAGRAVPVVGWGMLAYDVASIAVCNAR